LDVQQAADRYRARAATIRRWIRDGELPATKIGRRYVISDRDMRRALEMPRRRGRPSGIQRTRRAQWFHKIAFPDGALLGLGDASETWRKDLEHDWETYSRLLPNVAEAAAAVEYTTEKIHRAIAMVEAYYVPYLPALLDGPEPTHGRGASHPSVSDAYSEFANLLSWIRALNDRLEHKWKGAALGMLPALAPNRLQSRARILTNRFRRELAREAGLLANYSLHYSTIPYAFNSSARVVDGRLELPIPNRVTHAVNTFQDLKYSDGRTLSKYADEAASIVVTFMDALIDAFIDELPARVRRSGT
jgi:excisionase family DNA binding protein